VHDPIIIYNHRVEVKEILIVEPDMICYTAGHSIPAGMPIFNYEWELIGIHHTSTQAYKINQGTRVDALHKFLLGIRHIIPNSELDMMLETEPYEL
jgi:hypothetical protein